MKKNIAWIDTIRVLASLLVIFCHYLMCNGFTFQFQMDVRLYEIAEICISLFLALSGYLIHSSLERMTSLKDYYKKKLIRLVVPFTVCYLLMSIALMVLSLFDARLTDKVPLYHALFGAKYFTIICGMFPVNLNIMAFFNQDVSWFTGEWFMGIILCMFLISPILDKGATKAPILSLVASLIFSSVLFNLAVDWADRGFIAERWQMCLVRIPEFLLGIILFVHREKLLRIRRYLVAALLIYLAVYTVYIYQPYAPWFMYNQPACRIVTLPVIYLIFTALEWLNEFNFAAVNWFNGFSGISYMAMLSQHVIIYAFNAAMDFSRLSFFGTFYLLAVITWVIVIVSRKLQEYSAPVEKWFLKKREATVN